MRKFTSLVLASVMATSVAAASAGNAFAAEATTLTINYGMQENLTVIPPANYQPGYFNKTGSITANVGDIVEVSFMIKAKGDQKSIGSADFRTFFGQDDGLSVNLYSAKSSDNYLTYSTNYYPDNTSSSYFKLGATIPNPTPKASPNLNQQFYTITVSSIENGGDFSEWTTLYKFTVKANKAGETYVGTQVRELCYENIENGKPITTKAVDLFEYKTEAKVVKAAGEEKDVLYGDVNGDGIVNIVDRITLTRHLAGWDKFKTINTDNSDVNNDGNVNIADRIVLTRHIAGWDDYKTLPYKK